MERCGSGRGGSGAGRKLSTQGLRHRTFLFSPSHKSLACSVCTQVFPEAEHPFTDFDLVPFVPRVHQAKVPGIGFPLPKGLEAVNPEKYGFRTRVSPGLKSSPSPDLDLTTLMTEEERDLWQRQQQQQQQQQ